MVTETKTDKIYLTSTYVPNSIIELTHFRNLNLETDERAAIYLEDVSLVLNLKNMKRAITPDYKGDETEAEKVNLFNIAEEKSEKFGIQFLHRESNTGDWTEEVEIICVNRGRKDYISVLQPFFTKYSVRILSIKDAFAIRLVDYGFGLIKVNDTVKISMAIEIKIEKKNNLEEFEARLATLELAIIDKFVNLPANSLLGRQTGSGGVESIPMSNFITPTLLDQTILDLVGGAPDAFNTLKKLASALNNDSSFATNVTTQLASKAPVANPRFTGFVGMGDNANIKIKFVEGTTHPQQNNNVQIPHGIISASKIKRFR